MMSNPNFIPKSIIFKFKSICNIILEGNPDMTGLCVKAKMVVAESKEKLRDIIWETQELKVITLKKNLH